MSRLSERNVARKLRQLAETEPVEPSQGLLEKIKMEIPPALTVAPDIASRKPEDTGAGSRKWLIAASLVAVVGAGLLGVRVMHEAPAPGEAQKAAAPAAPTREAERLGEEDAQFPTGQPQAMQDRAAEAEPMPEPVLAPPPPAAPAPGERVDSLVSQQDAEGPFDESPPAAKAAPMARMKEEGRRQRNESPSPMVQPVEIPESQEVGGVEGGVVGGIAGGVAGGVPGGVPSAGYEAPERFSASATISQTELEKIPTAHRGVVSTTGGTAEPNDQPYGDVFFRSAGTNPFIDTEDDRLSTFGLDVDTGSYTVTRRYLNDGNLPPAEAIRVEEMLNFFDYGDKAPARGDFALRAEGAPSPFAQGERYYLLRFNVRGREIKAENRKPAVLTFVIDVSGSMDMENRLSLVKESLGLLLNQLRPSDKVGLVVYGNTAHLLLEPTSDKEKVRDAIERLQPEGATNAEAGLVLGYDVASRHFRSGASNRVVLCSDGVANVGRTGPDSILARIGNEAKRGLELTTLGFGMGNYNDVLMEQLADKGDGRYAYVDSEDEARRILVEELTGTLQTIAKDAKIQVEFDPQVVSRYRLLGYENRDIPDKKFRDDSVDAGEIGAGHSVTALYEVKLQPNASKRKTLATLRLRHKSVESGKVEEVERTLRLGDLASSWEEAPASLRLASLVAEFAEILKGAYWAKDGDLYDVFRRAQRVSGDFPGDVKVAEFVSLVGKAARLKGGKGER